MFDCFKSAGKTVSEYRTASSFDKIVLENNVDLVIVPNTNHYIKVTAGDNLMGGVVTELSGSTLYIRNENRCNWVRSFKNQLLVEVGMDLPKNIAYYGSGDIFCNDTIRSEEFTFDSWNGSGSINLLFNCGKTHINNNIGRCDYNLNGFSGVSFIYMNDVAVLNAGNLSTYYTYIRNKSTGDCRVQAKVELSAEIEYTGNIYYTGSPVTVNQKLTGEGKLISF